MGVNDGGREKERIFPLANIVTLFQWDSVVILSDNDLLKLFSHLTFEI